MCASEKMFSRLFKRFAQSASPRYLGCLRGGLLGCCLCVCLYVRSIMVASCAHFGSLPGGSWAHFGSLGGRLGTILGSLGTSWDQFWGSGGYLGLHFWGSGAPLASLALPGGPHWPPKAPKVKFSHFLPLHFGVILGTFWS